MNSCERMQTLDAVGMYITFSWASCLKSWLLLPVKKMFRTQSKFTIVYFSSRSREGCKGSGPPHPSSQICGFVFTTCLTPKFLKTKTAGWLIVLSGAEGASVSWEVMLTLLPKILQSKWKGKREGCVWWRTKMQTV